MLEERIKSFKLIDIEHYNNLTKEQRKMLKDVLVQTIDSKFYQVGKNGNLIRMIKPISLDPKHQKMLADEYQKQFQPDDSPLVA